MFTIVLPIRDTAEEREFMHRSIPAAIALCPAEIIIAVDAPMKESLRDEIIELAMRNDYDNPFRFLEVEKTSDWNFHLAKILWLAYRMAENDKIYSFDVDSIPTKNVLEGLKQIGNDGIAVYSFTKRLRLKNLSDLIRYAFYRYRVLTTDYVFSGNYWIDRKAFFEIVNEQEYRAIRNGVDTYLTEKLAKDGKFTIVTSKKIGVSCLSLQNEDLPWRQFQLGMWVGANAPAWRHAREERRKRRARRHPTPKSIIDKLLDNPILFIYLKALVYQHPHLLKGYRWARANPGHDAVKVAASMGEYEWGYQGGKYLKEIPGIEIKGTGA